MDKTKLLSRKDYDEWLKTIPDGTCTFCQWTKYQPIIREFKHWLWIENIAPYWYYHTLFIPKRHFVQESEMTVEELSDLIKAKEYALAHIMDSKLKFPSGKNKGGLIEKFVYFHRYRINRLDPLTGIIRPNHYHDHFCPDIDHRWDTTLDEDAHEFSIQEVLE